MSAPITKSQMAFELPKLSYIDTSLEEPAIRPVARPVQTRGLTYWIARFRSWREASRSMAELRSLTDRELLDVGLNRGDFDRMFDNRHNQDLNAHGRTF